MPLFEYVCRECGHVTEFLEKAGSRRPHPCRECGATDTDKAFSSFAAQSGSSADPPAACDRNCPAGSCPHARG